VLSLLPHIHNIVPKLSRLFCNKKICDTISSSSLHKSHVLLPKWMVLFIIFAFVGTLSNNTLHTRCCVVGRIFKIQKNLNTLVFFLLCCPAIYYMVTSSCIYLFSFSIQTQVSLLFVLKVWPIVICMSSFFFVLFSILVYLTSKLDFIVSCYVFITPIYV